MCDRWKWRKLYLTRTLIATAALLIRNLCKLLVYQYCSGVTRHPLDYDIMYSLQKKWTPVQTCKGLSTTITSAELSFSGVSHPTQHIIEFQTQRLCNRLEFCRMAYGSDHTTCCCDNGMSSEYEIHLRGCRRCICQACDHQWTVRRCPTLATPHSVHLYKVCQKSETLTKLQWLIFSTQWLKNEIFSTGTQVCQWILL